MSRSMRKKVLFLILTVVLAASPTFGQMTREKSMNSAFGLFSGFNSRTKTWFISAMGWNKEDIAGWAEEAYADVGSHWDRSTQELNWSTIEPVLGGGYVWDNATGTDTLIKNIYAADDYVNWLAVFHQGGGSGRDPLDYGIEYHDFVKAVVERYDGDGVSDASANVYIKYWQVANEYFGWLGSGRDEADYVTLVRKVRSAALEADPEAKIVLMAPVNRSLFTFGFTNIINDLAVSNEFDVVDVHHWDKATEWQMDSIPQLRTYLDNLGMTNVQIWSCENATWAGNPDDQDEQSEEQQARSMVKRFVWNRANGLDKLMWSQLLDKYRFENDSGSIYNSMGIITDGQDSGDSEDRINTARISYWTYKELAENTDNHIAALKGTVSGVHNESTIYAYEYTRIEDGGQTFIVWGGLQEQEITISVSGSIYAVKDLVPNRFGDFDVEDVAASGGQITVTVGADPLLIKSSSDTDGDGLSDELENTIGTDKSVIDTDGDGLSDYEEVTGINDSATLLDPDGNITDPLVVDEAYFSDLLTSREWTDIWGSTNIDSAVAVTIDASTNVYVAGYTQGEFDGQSNNGGHDITLSKFDSSGTRLWSRLWGTTNCDEAADIAVDSSGNIYVVGEIDTDALSGSGNGNFDICVIKFGSSGNVLWTNFWGTTNVDYGRAITIDESGHIYITGTTEGTLNSQTNYGGYDFVLVKIDSNGSTVWEKQWGSDAWDENTCMAVDSDNNIYVTGYTYGDVGGTNCGCVDLCTSKYDSNGNVLWSIIWGSDEIDYAWGMDIDSDGNPYIVGGTQGQIDEQANVGSFDVFVTKFNTSGAVQWTKQWGSSSADEGKDIEIDASDNLHIVGYTHGVFHSEDNAGGSDMFATVMTSEGTVLLTRIWGSSDDDESHGLALDNSGNVYVTGTVQGDLDSKTAIGQDDFCVTKWSPLASSYLCVFNDYDGDRKSDFAVFDSNTGYWYVLSSDGDLLTWEQGWGWPGAEPVAGDYDGDRESDYAVFDTGTGHWYILSSDGDLISWAQEWGWAGAEPVAGDYDGDRVSDLAVFDTNTGYWYVLAVDGSLITWGQEWGWAGAEPVSGDYNGDDISDYAVFDTNTGHWYILSSDGELITWAQEWGWPGAVPVPGDYDGDGIHDYAVFDSNTGHWYILSSDGSLISWAQEWGWVGADPVPGDYDGDGISDLAVFDTNTGYWYVLAVDGNLITWGLNWGWAGAVTID